jgi:hypothetical protein
MGAKFKNVGFVAHILLWRIFNKTIVVENKTYHWAAIKMVKTDMT